jgi:AcrR family transcriptional regulator
VSVPTPPEQRPLRDRKRERNRSALIEAAVGLFERQGYERTTIADIAEAAEMGPRTFFNYFTSKEEILFPDSEQRVQDAVAAIAQNAADRSPAQALADAVTMVVDTSDDIVGPLADVRNALIRTVPAVRGRALQIQHSAQQRIAAALRAAYPSELDDVTAAALVGATIGAVAGAISTLPAEPQPDPQRRRDAIRRGLDVVAGAWRTEPDQRP